MAARLNADLERIRKALDSVKLATCSVLSVLGDISLCTCELCLKDPLFEI